MLRAVFFEDSEGVKKVFLSENLSAGCVCVSLQSSCGDCAIERLNVVFFEDLQM